MKKMKILDEFTREEMKNLLLLVACGEWVLNSFRGDPLEDIEAVEQKFYRLAEERGFKEHFDREFDEKIFPNVEFEELMMRYIDEYDDYSFWEKLNRHLITKDMLKKYGYDKLRNMEFQERIEKEKEFVDKYDLEFSKSGLKNVGILKNSEENKR